MKIATKIWDSGWGAVFLTLYTGVVIHLFFPEHRLYKVGAIVPAILMMFFADQYSTTVIDFFAGGELKRSTEKVNNITGEKHFYESADETIQTRIDKLDRHAYQKSISILAGIIIAVTVPIIAHVQFGLIGAVIASVAALLVLQMLTRRSVEKLNELAAGISEPYEAKYENQ